MRSKTDFYGHYENKLCSTWLYFFFRDFEHPRLPAEEVQHFSEVLMNLFEAGLCQDLVSKFTIDFPVKAFNFFFRDKGEKCSRGTWAFNKEDFSLCKFPRGWDRATPWQNALHTSTDLSFQSITHFRFLIKIQCKQGKIPYREVWKQKVRVSRRK